MRIIGVVDLLRGRAVHAVAGDRARYQPVAHVAGDADALARHYVDDLGVDGLYVADLDAIQQRSPQRIIVSTLCRSRVPVYVDAGVSSVDTARDLLSLGAARIIVGLETLSSFQSLNAICAAVTGARVMFSLDLRNGVPITSEPTGQAAEATVSRAVEAGVQGVIVLDLARVGTGCGLDLDLIARLRATTPPHVALLAGGGVRGPHDLDRLAAAGCDGALVATALQTGTLTASDVAAIRQRTTSRPR